MVSFSTAIKNFYLKSFKFKGRATRSEFWWVELSYISALAFLISLSTLSDSLIVLCPIFILINAIPMISLQVRRFHDIGFSAWSLLLYAVPYIGLLTCLVLFAWPGDKFTNAYGSNPYDDKHTSDSNDDTVPNK